MHLHIGHTFFGAGNIGDDLVLAGFLKGVAQALPALKLTCATSFDIASQRRRFPQIEWSVYTAASRRSLIAACDAWVGLGGPLLQAADDSWLLADQALQIEACRRAGKPVFFAGCGVDYREDARRSEIQLLLNQIRWIWTRDTLSTTALQRMGFDRVTTAADFAHLVLRQRATTRLVRRGTGFICNFERETDYSVELLADLIEAAASDSQTVSWLVQEIRALPGSELDIHDRLPSRTRRLLDLRQPDYGAAGAIELIDSWREADRLFSSRFHGAIVGAWAGSRVVVFERHQKLRGLAGDLNLVSLSSMPERDGLMRAFDRATPVAQSLLDLAADRAQNACAGLLKAAAESGPALVPSNGLIREWRTIGTGLMPLIESHAIDGITRVDAAQLGVGLKRGEIFVVRGCLQAIGALEPLRGMILDTLEEVAGHNARIKAEARGLSRLHEFVPIDALMQMNPLMKQRARALAPDIVANLAAMLPGLGPDVHFEDTPNVRIFVPHDVSSINAAALAAYAKRRGGGELTLHPPHQDSRHFHPIGAINVWCAIDHVVEANGMSVFPMFYGHHLPFIRSDGGIRPDQYLGPPVAMDLAPGDVWIFETIHMHGSTINQTDQTRFVISFRLTGNAPHYRDKPWYSYIRPQDCRSGSPPANPIDYRQPPPDRGPVTIDTSRAIPGLVASSQLANGEITIPGALVPEGQIRPVSDRLCIARIAGKPVAFARRCPHEGADLAGGAIRNSRIMCVWHGLRMSAVDGSSGCRSVAALELFRSDEQDGVITISSPPEAIEHSLAPIDPFAEAVEHFNRAADRYHAALRGYGEARGQWGLTALGHARTSAVHALLGLPGGVIRTRLRESVGRLVQAVLTSGSRTVPRSTEEDTTFAECWRRFGQNRHEDSDFSYGLALLILSRSGFELLGLQPLARELGWTEPLWLQCLLETLPVSSLIANSDLPAEMLPPPMMEIKDRIASLHENERNELFRAARVNQAGLYRSQDGAGWSSLQEQVRTLTARLGEANADRELSHQHIHTLNGHLKEANADRELSHQHIHTLSGHLREANADRELSHQQIQNLADHLKAANAAREAIQRSRVFRIMVGIAGTIRRVLPRRI
jgi:polysaccharide pyruvyl transferase WcaK-like protein/nitrite reductase/ring-hydroxylating ferredoxin subunit